MQDKIHCLLHIILSLIILVYSSHSFQSEDGSLAFFHFTVSFSCTISFGIYSPMRIFTLLIVVVFPLQLLLLSPLYLSVWALLCGNTMISVLWYAELIGYAQNMTSNMYCWALLSLPSKLSLQELPYTGACGRCGHTLKTPRKCTCSLAHLGVWQRPISLNKTMGEVRQHISKWLSGKESVC